MSDQYRDEGGRLVAGPPLPDYSNVSTGRAGYLLALGLIIASLVGGVFLGRASVGPMSFHEYAEGLAQTKHCVPQIDWGVATEEGRVDAATTQAVVMLREQGMKNIEASSVPLVVAQKTYYIGIITWENCASGG